MEEAVPLFSTEMWKIIGSIFLVIGLIDILMTHLVLKKKLNILEVEMLVVVPTSQAETHSKKLRSFKLLSTGVQLMGAAWFLAGLYLITR